MSLPSFDNTLGALFIGSNVATILYGVICLQTFLYITAARSHEDKWWLRSLVFLFFALDSAHQLTMMAAMYKFLVSDFSNPALLPTGSAGSGEVFVFASSCIGGILVLLIQLFFCWRLWIISMASLRIEYRLLFIGLTVSLALLSFASSMDLAVTGFDHRLLTANTPDFILAYKLSTSTGVSFDVMVTIAMTISLHRARSSRDAQNRRTDHVITLLTLFTVNTNLITTCLSISELVTFLALPNATVYGGIGFLTSKTYLNSFLAVLNSRDYLREKLGQNKPASSTMRREEMPRFAISPQHKSSAASRDPQSFEVSTFDHSSNLSPNRNDSNIYGPA